LGLIAGSILEFRGNLPARINFRYEKLPGVVRVVSYVYGTNASFPPRQIIESVINNNQEKVLGTNLIMELVLGDAGISPDGYLPAMFRTKNLDRPLQLQFYSNNILHELLPDGQLVKIEEMAPHVALLHPKLPVAKHVMWALIVLGVCLFPLLYAARRKNRNQAAN
jgi:hypothetical protein